MPYTRAAERSAVLMVGPSTVAAAPVSATHSAAVAVNAPALLSDSKADLRTGVCHGPRVRRVAPKTGMFGPNGSPDAGSGPSKVAQLTGMVGLFGKDAVLPLVAGDVHLRGRRLSAVLDEPRPWPGRHALGRDHRRRPGIEAAEFASPAADLRPGAVRPRMQPAVQVPQ